MAVPARSARSDIARWDPASEFDRLTQQMSRLFEDQWAEVPSMLRDGFTPLADLEEEVVLPDNVKQDGVEATLNDGVLRVTVPKGSAGQRRQIEVT